MSRTRSTTDGWGEAVHKRLLLNPDEIGRFLARIDDPKHPAHPGVVLVLIPGEHPLPVHRVNYFASHWFDGFFDPHPDHPPPPTLSERIAQIVAAKRKELAPPPERRLRPVRKFAALGVAAMMIAGIGWWFWTGYSSSPKPMAPPIQSARPPADHGSALWASTVTKLASILGNTGNFTVAPLPQPVAIAPPPTPAPLYQTPAAPCGGNSDERVKEPILTPFSQT